MKEIWLIMGFGAGVVAGTLLYKHCQEAKQIVNKSEKVIKKEIDDVKDKMKKEKQSKSQTE